MVDFFVGRIDHVMESCHCSFFSNCDEITQLVDVAFSHYQARTATMHLTWCATMRTRLYVSYDAI
jgi:hypothetical protein